MVGVVGDISTRADRGGFLGLATIGPMFAPTLGPVIGGVLADKLGWRSIFWFLCITSSICAVVMILFLPETLRAIVGNGSIPLPRIYHAVIPIIGRQGRKSSSQASTAAPSTRKKFQNPLLLLLHADIALLLLINGIVYSVFYGVVASISSVFHEAYPQLSETDLGLCFITLGGGQLVGSWFCGRLLDWDYQRLRLALKEPNVEQVDEASGKVDDSFPIEKARLRLLPTFLAFYVVSCIGYGWCIDKRTHMSGPLILLAGGRSLPACVFPPLSYTPSFISSHHPELHTHSAQQNNLVRCGLGAALVSSMQPLLDALGTGYAYVLLGGLSALMTPLLYVVMYIGPRCRARRIRMAMERRERE
ncbi:major facilitator superfamily domain-containing protein [Favolaschia claudopus]|uniref:Major facilitator superfamily domain-containing protein n=1 Tax=Favolaschia claudopus TaxID=2862362 RepID=A0AAW0A5X5_9AGAR